MQYKQSIRDLMLGVDQDLYLGFCLACGEQNENIEPDARHYTCQHCNARKVYGCEELILMGLYYDDSNGKFDNHPMVQS